MIDIIAWQAVTCGLLFFTGVFMSGSWLYSRATGYMPQAESNYFILINEIEYWFVSRSRFTTSGKKMKSKIDNDVSGI